MVGLLDIKSLRPSHATILAPSPKPPKGITSDLIIALPDLCLHVVGKQNLGKRQIPGDDSGGVYKITKPYVVRLGVQELVKATENFRPIILGHSIRLRREGAGHIVS